MTTHSDSIELALWLTVNDRIAESCRSACEELGTFVCECPSSSCRHRFDAPLDDYARVRAEPGLRLVATAVHAPEDPVRVGPGYAVVASA